MYRLVFRIIIYIIAILLGGFSRRDRYYGYGNVTAAGEGTGERIRLALRRRSSLNKCKKFISKKNKNSIVLKNNHVVLAYDSVNKTIMCINASNIKVSAFVEWDKQLEYIQEGIYDNTFELAFDHLCASFNENTTYEGLVNFLKQNFNIINETGSATKGSHKKSENTPKIEEKNTQVKRININEASENELAKLPGINIATAKKIVKRVQTKGDFISAEQMYSEMKIKNHFKMQLSEIIYAQPVLRKNKEMIEKNNDRIIDL